MALVMRPEVADARGEFRIISDSLSVSFAVVYGRGTSHRRGHGIVNGLGWGGGIRNGKMGWSGGRTGMRRFRLISRDGIRGGGGLAGR